MNEPTVIIHKEPNGQKLKSFGHRVVRELHVMALEKEIARLTEALIWSEERNNLFLRIDDKVMAQKSEIRKLVAVIGTYKSSCTFKDTIATLVAVKKDNKALQKALKEQKKELDHIFSKYLQLKQKST